ncbi:hypothetical protein ACTFIR_003568 [Dictyostelium discoideum]
MLFFDIGQFYYELAHYLGLNETVKFVDYDGLEKELNKKQLLIKAIETKQDSPGTTKSKLDILSETPKYNIQSLFEFETQVIDQLLIECEAKSATQRESYCRVISADPLFSLAYLKLGIEMQKYSIDDYLIDTIIYEKEGMPFIYGKGEIKFTRKQLFLKFLELS